MVPSPTGLTKNSCPGLIIMAGDPAAFSEIATGRIVFVDMSVQVMTATDSVGIVAISAQISVSALSSCSFSLFAHVSGKKVKDTASMVPAKQRLKRIKRSSQSIMGRLTSVGSGTSQVTAREVLQGRASEGMEDGDRLGRLEGLLEGAFEGSSLGDDEGDNVGLEVSTFSVKGGAAVVTGTGGAVGGGLLRNAETVGDVVVLSGQIIIVPPLGLGLELPLGVPLVAPLVPPLT